ncbi:DUF4913 domain-containing protein [Nocardia goodfellowii]|uniref:DUF4913 domain-containing protein n=1 Tax=Nocardia goodfellowii TaxID=882446 RepID=A0ABS4QU20_9NOCA|nr:DUF4913 domain-containing protein [Nocardia goodfellowii]MBP2194544.1 hypothetical protein [Nocardia goodfellowii]
MSDNGNGTEPTTAPAQDAAVAVAPQMDLGELLGEAIRKAVTGQINAQAKDIAAGVVGEMLTKEVIAGMRVTAEIEAERALNSGPTAEPEPEPEPEPVPAPEEEPAPRELKYASVKEFVEDYIAVIYRRDVGSRLKQCWCPKWWLHGETIGRFEALHVAFESLRHGEETELAAWWLTYLDPMMDRILDKEEGPFKYCSPENGHVARLTPLPVVEAPADLFKEHDDEHDGEQVGTLSQIEVPPGPLAQRRVIHGVWEPPEDRE